jgi:hypothetical protein
MAYFNDWDADAERDQFTLRGDFGPQGSWCKIADRPDFTRDYEWRFRWRQNRDEPDQAPDAPVSAHYSGGTQTYGGIRKAAR